MRLIRWSLLLTGLTASVALAAPNTAGPQKPAADDRPPGTVDSGVIMLEQIKNELKRYKTERYGTVLNYVLPKGWDLVEEGKDPVTGKIRDNAETYAIMSRRPMPNPKDPTDFVFELDVYDHDLLEGVAKDATKEQKGEAVMKGLWDFLDTQMGIYERGGLKVNTQRRDIQPKPYGPEGSRPKTIFVPIAYEVSPVAGDKDSHGAMLYTFTSFTEGKNKRIWVLKFLVSKDQVTNYQALIALIVNNAWGYSSEIYDQLMQNTAKVAEREAEAHKNAGKSGDAGKNKGKSKP